MFLNLCFYFFGHYQQIITNSKSSPSFSDVIWLRKHSFTPLGSIVNCNIFGSVCEVLKSKIYGVTFPLDPVNYLLGNLSGCQSPFASFL